ncbi:MAG: alginate export family protein, partial [Verrucomicrobia bacterium]|nr:alginate export family protein [Verrucomicrobiota bacterium]
KVLRNFTDKVLWTVEGAYQFGHKEYPGMAAPLNTSREISAYGFNSMLTYQFKDSLNDQFRFSFEFLSGSEPGSTKDNNFDILWGRYPRWSELYVYTASADNKRPGQYQDLIRFGPGWSFDPVKNLNFIAEYAALFAPESSMVNPTFGTGNFRGHYAWATMTYKFCDHLKGHLWAEFLFPGSFYAQKNMASFLRAELHFTF